MIQLFLVRHGNTFEAGQTPVQVGARTDLPLTSQGRLQAEQMGKYLLAKQILPAAIYAGRLKRQTEFAAILSAPFGLVLQEAPALTEIDYGLWEGLSAEAIASRWPKEYAEWTEQAKWPHHIFQKTDEEHRNQLEEWLNLLRKKDQANTVFAVTSNGLMRFFKNEKVKTGHFCEIHLQKEGLQICSWNRDPHG